MEWSVVHQILTELQQELASDNPFTPRASSGRRLLVELTALDDATSFEVESVIRQITPRSPLPHLDAPARFMLHLRVLHALPFPILFEVPCSVSATRIVPEVGDSQFGFRCALSWLLDDLWAVDSESLLAEFCERRRHSRAVPKA
jgi:hypothetical protein